MNNNVNTYRLKDICTIKSGKRIPLGMDFTTEITEHPYIRARDIKGGYILTDNLVYLNDDVYAKIKKYIINAGDIAITIVGASIGDVSYAQNDVDGYNLTENAVRLTQFKNFVNSKYLFYVLSQNQYRDYMQLVAGGAAQPKLGIYKVERIKVQLPSIEVQNNVVNILSSFDACIENNLKRIKLLEETAYSIYKEWFINFRFPGYTESSFVNKLPKGWVSGNGKSRIPANWHYGELQELGKFIRGKNITAEKMVEGSIPVISAGISPSGMHNSSNVSGRSLTISASGANAGYLMYHMTDIWAADCSYYQDDSNIWFVYNSLKYLQPVISNMQAGAAQPHVYPKHVNKISLIIPESTWIKKFCDLVEPFYDEIKLLDDKSSELVEIRSMIMPRILSN